MVLWRTFWPDGDEIKGEWRKLRGKELNDLNTSQNIIRTMKSREMRWNRRVAATRRGDVYTGFFGGKPEGKRSLGGPRRRREDNTKTDLQKMGMD